MRRTQALFTKGFLRVSTETSLTNRTRPPLELFTGDDTKGIFGCFCLCLQRRSFGMDLQPSDRKALMSRIAATSVLQRPFSRAGRETL